MAAKQYGARITVSPNHLGGSTLDTWMAVVFTNLRHLHVTQTGGVVIDFLSEQPNPIVILPYQDAAKPVNADATPYFWDDGYVSGRPVRNGDGDRIAPAQTGTGAGSAATVRFTPWRFRYAGLPEATLLHELVHAAAIVSGRLYTNKTGWQFDTQAEFDAIMVENIYRSEKGLNLRANHHGWAKQTEWLPIPNVEQYRKLLTSFRSRMPVLTGNLARLGTGFNPFRAGAQGYVAL